MSITAIASLLIGPISDLLGKIIPDKDKAAALAAEIATLAEKQAHEQIIAQLQVNLAEASNPSLFVSGWRPFIGWTCGAAMAFNYVVLPILSSAELIGAVQPLDLDVMMPVLLGMLGLGGMRSYEKRNGVARVK